MTEIGGDDDTRSGGGKNNEKKEEVLSSYEYNDVVYNVGDTVYIESQRSDMPYYICSIMDFKKSKKDNVNVDVVWYYRPCEIPTSVYQSLLQDRHHENGSSDHVLENPVVKDRELFISDAVDIFPATALRGHARCLPFSDVKENILDYINDEDNWFYILRYNPESRRMANAKGEIRIGASHQAILPPCIPLNERSKTDRAELNHTCKEVLCWEPVIKQPKLTVYLRAARSITSYSGFCESQDGTIPEKAIDATPDDLSINYSYDILHKHNYNISEALQFLMKNPAPKKKMIPWTDDERKRFMRGLRSYGKYFHKIRKELLPERTTSDLVQYYYMWKKTAIAQNSRPHKKGGCRRSHIRKTRTSKPKTTVSSEFLDLSSCSESEVLDADDSENDARYLYACRHCYTTQSPNWHHAGKNKLLLCHSCRVYFKRYAHMKPLTEDEKRDPPPFIYKAAFENLEGCANYSGRMRTRRSATPVFANGVTIKSRIIQDAKQSTRKQVTTPNFVTNEDSNDKAPTPMKRKISEESDDGKQDMKKTRLIMRDEENAEDADDESDGESVTTGGVIATGECPLSPRGDEGERKNEEKSSMEQASSFTPISEAECPSTQLNEDNASSPDLRCSSPEDIPDDIELNRKIEERFKHKVTEEGNSCSRCEMIFTFKRPKKVKTVETETTASKHKDDTFENSRSLELTRGGSSPRSHQPAQITSHFETMRLIAQQQAMNEPRFWHGFRPDIHPHRPVSPRDFVPVEHSKHVPYLKSDRGLPDHMSHPPHFSPHQNHSHHFPGRASEHAREYRSMHGERTHVSPHGIPHPNIEGRFPHENVSSGILTPIERPPLDPMSGLSAIQPHLHSHLHTHTHLHVHPDDIKYRGVHPESHHDRLERNTPHHIVPPTPHPCRPSSAGRDYHENISMLLQPDPHLRETMNRHLPGSIRAEGNHPAISREGAVSPSFPRDMPSVPSDPVAYHLWVTQLARMHPRQWNSHSNSSQQAPDLSPHGLPSAPGHHSHNPHGHLRTSAEQEKHIHEKLMQAEREKLHDKHMRHILHSREHIDPKLKSEHNLLERGGMPFKPSDVRNHYANSHFMEGMRRTPHEAFMLHDRSIHERMTHERLERDRLSQLERSNHMDRFERTRHDRPSIFGRYKPEMIDLSDD